MTAAGTEQERPVSAIRRFLERLSEDRLSPAMKQYPFTIALTLALLTAVIARDLVNAQPLAISVCAALMVLATVFAVVASSVPSVTRFALLVPLLDVLAIGVLRAGSGGPDSPFNALLILPVLWIAAEQGRRYIVLATLATVVAMVMPAMITRTLPTSTYEVLRGVFTPLIFLLAATIVNELARRLRDQFVTASRLADEKERMLQRTVEYAAQLQESEERVRAAETMFRSVWSAVTEQSVIATDAEGLVVAWNPGATRLLGISAPEAQDHLHVFELHDPDELEAHAKELGYPHGATVLNPGFSALVEQARQGSAENREWTYLRRDGERIPVLLSVTARRNAVGELDGYLFVASDQTQAREVARLKDDFVGLISHELRTPLSSVLGYLELLREDDRHPLAAEQLRYVEVAERNANRLLHLVGDLLFTAQVEAGRFPLDLVETDLRQLVTAAVDTARPAAADAGVTVVLESPEEPLTVFGDAFRLGQAVDNLVSNAIKFTPRDGTVTVTVAAEPGGPEGSAGAAGWAMIRVRDTGLGIPEDELELLFARFFRASTATRNAVPGVGLGLPITQAIVLAHSGTIDVASTVGEGTVFTIRLPLA